MWNRYTNKAFLEEISRIKDPLVFIGLAKLCGAKLTDTNKVNAAGKAPAREFSEILDDIMAKYNTLGRKKRKELMKAIIEANHTPNEEGEFNGNRTEDKD